MGFDMQFDRIALVISNLQRFNYGFLGKFHQISSDQNWFLQGWERKGFSVQASRDTGNQLGNMVRSGNLGSSSRIGFLKGIDEDVVNFLFGSPQIILRCGDSSQSSIQKMSRLGFAGFTHTGQIP